MSGLVGVEHPYHCALGDATTSTEYESWEAFIESDGADLHPDLNHLYRWDWYKTNPDDGRTFDELHLCHVIQRKGHCWVACVRVTEKDEPAVRAYLKAKMQYVQALWTPFDFGAPP